MRCLVQCGGVSACQSTRVVCDPGAPCAVTCSGTSACIAFEVDCPSGAPCDVLCNGTSSCNSGQVKCSKGACTVACTTVGARTSVTCDGSCLCSSKCP